MPTELKEERTGSLVYVSITGDLEDEVMAKASAYKSRYPRAAYGTWFDPIFVRNGQYVCEGSRYVSND